MSCPFCSDQQQDSLDSLLRDCTMKYGHIQLFRDADGWQASVYHYEPKHLTHDGKAQADPVQALRLALIEDERRARDLERKYQQAPKKAAVVKKVQDEAPPLDADGFCMICENGGNGCDACRPVEDDDFEGMF